jgi:hypothetical protein
MDADAVVRPFQKQPYSLREEAGFTLMLDIRLITSDRVALPYSYLVSIEYEKTTGLMLSFTSHQVLIKGRNLDPLYEGFLSQRVEYIQANDEMHDTGPDAITFISAIEVDTMTE